MRVGMTWLRDGTPGLSEYGYRENKKQRADKEVSHVSTPHHGKSNTHQFDCLDSLDELKLLEIIRSGEKQIFPEAITS
jgi:hypothetical protein